MPPDDGHSRLQLVQIDPRVAFYVQRDYGGGPVLVLGAADGRLAFELAARGNDVVAVEPSDSMFASAQQRLRAERSEAVRRTRLLQADLRSLRLEQRFPAVVAPQNALGLLSSLEDLHQFFETARLHLAPGGTLVLDATHPRVVSQEPPGSDASLDDPLDRPVSALRGAPAFVPHFRFRSASNGQYALARAKGRPFDYLEVDEALHDAGLLAVERFGNFRAKPFELTDPLQIIVAVREPLPPVANPRQS